MREQDQQTRVLSELCSMIIHILRSPPLPVSFPRLLGPSAQPPAPPSLQISPAAFGSLFLGISFALMLLGSVIFLIGVLLMPLVITLVLLFYFVGIICNLSEFGRAILWPGSHKVAPEGLNETVHGEEQGTWKSGNANLLTKNYPVVM